MACGVVKLGSTEPSSGMVRQNRRLLLSLCLAVGLGCSSQKNVADEKPNDSHIKPITSLYTGYMNRHADRPPASEAEFKQFIAEGGDAVLKAAGVSTLEELFVSPRDNQPYVILYGNDAARLISRGIVVYERNGNGGRRLVGYRMGFVNEVDDAEFRKLVPQS